VTSAELLPRSAEKLGAADWIAHRLRRLPGLMVSLLVGGFGALVLAGAMISLGLVTTHALLSVREIAEADTNVPVWLASHRSAFLADISSVGSRTADAVVLVPLVVIFASVLVLRGRRTRATILVLAALVEVWAYVLMTGLFHARDLKRVPDGFASTTSPAGHVAAAIAIYGALAIALTPHFQRLSIRFAVRGLAATIALLVLVSKLYRGEHHLLDVLGGAAMGLGALLIALLAETIACTVNQLRAGATR
jgi:membrane-associated phospholipid phosphatase